MRHLLILSIFILTGCAADLPLYEPMPPTEAWELMAQRAASITTVAAEADVTLTDADGRHMRVDAAIVMAPPDRARLRAWKLGHGVLDITADAATIWIDAPMPPEGQSSALDVPPEALARALLMIPGWAMQSMQPALSERRESAYHYRIEIPEGDLTCDATMRTLLVTRWRDDAVDATIELGDHRSVNGVAWPHDVTLSAEGRSVHMRFRHVDLNHDVDPRAWTPAPGARRLP